jgi:hypothetical protein
LGSVNLVLWGSACAGLANVCFGLVANIEPGMADLFYKATHYGADNPQSANETPFFGEKV